ncbi:hypothetical protein EDB85DRAFT_1884406 [Lactarius pseudohatsudake]|nr:hypothetical protein EDB85DRAFT_1884406 [Lactarius pseudohatsudake]
MAPWTAGIVVIVFTRSEPDRGNFNERQTREGQSNAAAPSGGYYDNVIFHRVIPKLMIQTGDPLGDGTGGTSTWDRDFEDEFADDVKHESARSEACIESIKHYRAHMSPILGVSANADSCLQAWKMCKSCRCRQFRFASLYLMPPLFGMAVFKLAASSNDATEPIRTPMWSTRSASSRVGPHRVGSLLMNTDQYRSGSVALHAPSGINRPQVQNRNITSRCPPPIALQMARGPLVPRHFPQVLTCRHSDDGSSDENTIT